MFLHVSVSHSVQGGWWLGGGIPACIANLQAHTQRGSWGVWSGGSAGPHPGGKLRGLVWRVSRPTPRGEVEGSGLGGLQAQTWGSPGLHRGGSPGPHLGVSRPTPGGLQAHTQWSLQAHTWGVSRPPTRAVSRPTPRGYPSMHWGRPPTNQTATAAGGTHPTGMHSCYQWNWLYRIAETVEK